MTATVLNIVIEQGATFSQTFDASALGSNLSLWSANSVVRRWYGSANSYPFAAAIQGSNVVLSMTANNTANLEVGRNVYDIKMTDPSGNVTRLYEGIVTVDPEVT